VIESPSALADYREAVQLLRRLADVRWFTPAPEATIQAAEGALALTFPPSLRAFIAEVGFCQIGGREILGLRGDSFATDAAVNVVGATLLARRSGLAAARVVVENPGDGTRLVVDTSRAGRIWVWIPGQAADKDPSWEFDHFGALLLQAALDQAEEEGVDYDAGVR
jgi:hypothetical protein